MAVTMDYYDVQAMVEKVVSEERYARIRHVEEMAGDFRAMMDEERAIREESDNALQRTLDARTANRV